MIQARAQIKPPSFTFWSKAEAVSRRNFHHTPKIIKQRNRRKLVIPIDGAENKINEALRLIHGERDIHNESTFGAIPLLADTREF